MSYTAGEWILIIGAIVTGITTVAGVIFAGLQAMRGARAAELGNKQSIIIGQQNEALAQSTTQRPAGVPSQPSVDLPSVEDAPTLAAPPTKTPG